MSPNFTMTSVLVLQPLSTLAEDDATYLVKATVKWTAQAFPHEYPADPHFSGFIGVSHNSRYSLFVDGATASSGLGLVATNGGTSVLKAEFAEAVRRKHVGAVFETDGLSAGVGEFTLRVTVTKTHDHFSFATMLAPSPDWVTGVSIVILAPDGARLDGLELPLWVWDAGVDRGSTYTAPNEPVQPRESVRLAAGPQFLYESGLKSIGRVTFTRID